MFATMVGVDQDGVSRLSAEYPQFVTFRRKECVSAYCENNCRVTVERESGEHTASELECIPLMPLVVQASEAFK